MNIQAFVNGNAAPLPLNFVGGDPELVLDIQQRLVAEGLVDPPADSAFGPVTQFALKSFCERAHVPTDRFDVEVARALLDAPSRNLFPLDPQDDFAGRVVRGMLRLGHWVGRHPDYRNIVYVEGCDKDGRANDNLPNHFNDLRLLIQVGREGVPRITAAWEGTTEPGRKFTIAPMNPKLGAARIAFGQYKSWTVGIHKRGSSTAHEALVQAANVTVFRDLDKDFQRKNDKTFTGLFGINQHWGFDLPVSDIGAASAGCLVGRAKADHRSFMKLVKEDPRFVVNNGYRFMSTVMPVAAIPLPGEVPDFDVMEMITFGVQSQELTEAGVWLLADDGRAHHVPGPPDLEALGRGGVKHVGELSRDFLVRFERVHPALGNLPVSGN